MKKLSKVEKMKQLWETYRGQSEKTRNELTFAEWVTINNDWLVAERERLANLKGALKNA